MKKSTFIDYNVILAVLSNKNKKHPAPTDQLKLSVLEVAHSNSNPKKEEHGKIAAFSKELVA